jgi:hypothetical protein
MKTLQESVAEARRLQTLQTVKRSLSEQSFAEMTRLSRPSTATEAAYDSDDYDSEEYDSEEYDSEEEQMDVRQAVKNAFQSGSLSTSTDLSRIMDRAIALAEEDKPSFLRISKSAPDFRPSVSQSDNKVKATAACPAAAVSAPSLKPQAVLQEILRNKNLPARTHAALELENFFVKPTPQSIQDYDLEIVKAVRKGDIATLRESLKAGKTMQCSNRFGESIVHAACRRGAVRTLKFLLEEAKVDVRVVCDYGRTPLHDACWTPSANLEVVRLLLERCPDLLHITDRRNFTPLDYIHKDNWAEWCAFLKNNADLVVPKQL